MLDPEKLFKKWQGWLLGDLLRQFRDLARDHYIFDQFMLSINPAARSLRDGGIASWMALNHLEKSYVTFRRLADKSPKSISLRTTLESVLEHADLLTDDNLERYNPNYRATPGGSADAEGVRGVLASEIDGMTRGIHEIKKFVDKTIAHWDENPKSVKLPNTDQLYLTVFNFHRLYRKWAWCIAGLPPIQDESDPMSITELIEGPVEDYKSQFSRLWQDGDNLGDTLMRFASIAGRSGQSDLAHCLMAVLAAVSTGTVGVLASLLNRDYFPHPDVIRASLDIVSEMDSDDG